MKKLKFKLALALILVLPIIYFMGCGSGDKTLQPVTVLKDGAGNVIGKILTGAAASLTTVGGTVKAYDEDDTYYYIENGNGFKFAVQKETNIDGDAGDRNINVCDAYNGILEGYAC